jgi:hypothetical protein
MKSIYKLMYCSIILPFFLQYLTNAENLISSWFLAPKLTLMIPQSFHLLMDLILREGSATCYAKLITVACLHNSVCQQTIQKLSLWTFGFYLLCTSVLHWSLSWIWWSNAQVLGSILRLSLLLLLENTVFSFLNEYWQKRYKKVKLSRNRPWRPIGLWNFKDPTLSRQSAHS